ncbi:MAG: hypothetical protein ACR2HR_17210 [Euzebya sp.]
MRLLLDDDCVLLDHAVRARRAVVTDNIPDFLRCHQRRVNTDSHHFGLLLFSNDSFPRHRHELFASHLVAPLRRELSLRGRDDNTSWIVWLQVGG